MDLLIFHLKTQMKFKPWPYIYALTLQQMTLQQKKNICLLSYVFMHVPLFYFCFLRNQNANIDFNKKKRTIQRLKRGVLPKNPTSVAEILAAFSDKAVFDTYGKTLHQKEDFRFFVGAVETEKFSYCLFSSPKTIRLIEQHIPVDRREILMDATFRIVPVGPFKQLLILYIRYGKKVFTIQTI